MKRIPSISREKFFLLKVFKVLIEITLTTGMLGHVSQINTQRISIYFEKLRHHKDYTDMNDIESVFS